jgi:hypothetical protein
MKLNFAHLADYAVRTSDGKLTVVGISSQIVVPSIPCQLLMYGAFEWGLTYAEVNRQHPLSVEIVDQDGQKIWSMTGHATVQPKQGHQPKPGELIGFGQVVALAIQFKRDGRHETNFFADNRLVHTLTFDVVLLPPKIKAA